jgi:lipopolysaccharide export system protein LptA
MRLGTFAACLSALLLSGAPDAGAQAGKHDVDQPIEINADSLEVLQKDRRAVFRGNVDARQGRLRLKADELEVHYQSKGEASQVAGSITRIDARGSVFVSLPMETAQGDVGVYDVTAKKITLTGKVVLTRGDNVIRGQRLVLDLATGKSRIEGGGGRVRGYFVPRKKDTRK